MSAKIWTRRGNAVYEGGDCIALFDCDNRSTAEIVTNAETERLRDALVTQRAWVEHWQQDAAHGLKPTENSLRKALATINDALAGVDEHMGDEWMEKL